MKVTNLSQAKVYLKDLKFVPQSQTEGRRGEDVYIGPGASKYLPDTSEVLRSAHSGDLKQFVTKGIVALHDVVALAASPGPGDEVTLAHGLGYPPTLVVTKVVGSTYVDATGTVDIVHNDDFTETTVTNATAIPITFLIRVGLWASAQTASASCLGSEKERLVGAPGFVGIHLGVGM